MSTLYNTPTRQHHGVRPLQTLLFVDKTVDELYLEAKGDASYFLFLKENNYKIKEYAIMSGATINQAHFLAEKFNKVADLLMQDYYNGETNVIDYIDDENDEYYYKYTPEAEKAQRLSFLIKNVL